MKKQQKTVLVFALVLVFLSGLSYSQSRETAAIEGKVTDSEGIPLPGAEVKLSSPQMIGGDRSQVTGAEGKFRFVGRQPGVYSIEASLVGFAPQKRVNFRLSVGQTLTVDFALAVGRLEEEITVIAVAPLIDVKDSSVATRVLDEHALKNVIFDGQTREMYIYSVIDLAAGTTPQYHGSSAYGGAGRTGNAYLMDGVEISESRSGQTWAIPDPNIFEEARVQGLGAPAEYDGFQGVVLSMVTKSGGNTFDGMGLIFYTDSDWESKKHIDITDPMFSLYSEPDGHAYTEARFGIGGPLIVDKLWFYGAISYLKHGFSRINAATGVESKWTKQTPRYFMKLTFQPVQSTRFQVFIDLDDFIYDYRYQTVYRPEIAASFEHCFTYINNLTAFHSFSDKTFMEFKIARSHNTDWYGGMVDDFKNVSGRHNDLTGMYSVNYKNWTDYVDYRFQVNTSLSHHADDFIQGSHDFKLGVEYEQIVLDRASDYNGTYFYEDMVYSWADNEYHTYAYARGPDAAQPRGRRYSIFVQDTWSVTDNLTINPGIRYNVYNGYLGTVGETLFKTSGLAPRIGITWDIFGDHKTALKVHWGRFFDKFNHNKFDGASAGLKDWIMYEVALDGTKTEIDRTTRSNPAVVDPDIKYPSVDQFTLGIERELAPDISAGFTFVYKTWKNSISKLNIGRSYALTEFTFDDENGVEHTYEVYDRSGTSTYFITNPAPGVSWVGTRPDIARPSKADYIGLLFSFEKRFSNKWMLAGSYSHSKRRSWTTGTNPNSELAFQRWGGKPIAYWYPNFKVYGTFILPLDITLSPTFEYRGGSRWENYVRAPVGGSPNVDTEKPGSNKLPAVVNLDVRTEKIITVKDDLRLGLFLDVYNILNLGRETGIESRITRSSYGLATDVNLGRMFRIGLRVYF